MPKEDAALFHAIARRYAAWLMAEDRQDHFMARQAFCKAEEVHPKLLESNPLLGAIEGLFGGGSAFERMQEMTLRDYMRYHYYYNHLGFRYGAEELQQTWMGHRLIKSPFDCWMYQELLYSQKPDVLIELGVMFGGATRFFADLLDLIGHGEVLGIDIDISKARDVKHDRISFLEGSSVSDAMIAEVRTRVQGKKVMVIADSDHEKNHVLEELRCYAEFVQPGGYLIAEDSLNDPMGYHPVPNEGPQAAVHAFLAENDAFEVDMRIAEKYIMTISPYGFLRRVT